MSRWRKFWRLSGSERRLVVTAAVLLPVVGAMLRVFGFARSQSILTSLTRPRSGAQPASIDEARSSARLVRAAAERGVYRATCLPQSLLLWSLLRRRGEDAILRVGVRKNADRVHAHAWVECRGVVINDDPDVHAQFTAFERVTVQ